jgi:hypothetical protein
MNTVRNTAEAGLPPYSGLDGRCPRCGVSGAMTECHWAAPFAPQDMAGRKPPCARHRELAATDGTGEHLCRVCLNCGHGWTEACTGAGTAAAPALCTGLLSLAAGLASAGARALLGTLFSGAALLTAWLAITIAVAVMAAIGHTVIFDGTAGTLTTRPDLPANAMLPPAAIPEET